LNGVAWVTSDGTYEQANDADTFNANAGTINIIGHIYGQFKIHFQNSNSQSNVSNLDVEVTGQTYSTDNPTIKPNATLNTEALINFEAEIEETGDDKVLFMIEVNRINKWYNGSAWVNSSGYPEANTAEEIVAAAEYLFDEYALIKPIIILHSDDGSSTPAIESMTIEYDFKGTEPDDPDKCIVYGYLKDISGDPVEGATITVTLKLRKNNQYRESSDSIILTTTKTTITLSDGYFDFELIKSEQYETTREYRISARKDSSEILFKEYNEYIDFIVPDQDSVNITEQIN
jgi:hypothetical protein